MDVLCIGHYHANPLILGVSPIGITHALLIGMTIYIVTDMRGVFMKAFACEARARCYVLAQPGKFNVFSVDETELDVC